MSNQFGSDGQWKFMFLCAIVGILTLVAAALFVIAYIAKHLSWTP